MNEKIITVSNLSKKYKMYDKASDRVKEVLNPFKRKYGSEFSALSDVSFSISKGENVGIIGKNGSGKSTLLKLITGVIQPTKGEINVAGKISPILELGAGFNPEFTGIQNIYNNGLINGLTKQEMDEKIDEIIKFSELGEFIYQPVKTYSSGMYARLAFSVAINIDPDILIVDEALAVGDMGFQHKCMNKMKELVDKGITILFVSHDTFAVKGLCKRCIYLEDGKVKADGNSQYVTDLYLKDIRTKIYAGEEEIIKQVNKENSEFIEETIEIPEEIGTEDQLRYGSGGARICELVLRDKDGNVKQYFEYGELIKIDILINTYIDINKMSCSIRLRDKNGIDVTGTTTREENIIIPSTKAGDKLHISFSFYNKLKHDMSFSVGVDISDIKEEVNSIILDHIDIAYTFKSLYNPTRPVWYMYYEDFKIDIKVN